MDIPQIAFKKVLYTTDLSETGRFAFAYAASLAHTYKAELTVLHVLDEGPELASRLVGYMDEKLWEEIKKRDLEEAQKILLERKRDNAAIRQCVDDYCSQIQSDTPGQPYVTYDIKISFGNPVEQIVAETEKGGYDVIVMGNLGHSTLKDAVLGSNVQRVLRRATVPVLLVPIPEK